MVPLLGLSVLVIAGVLLFGLLTGRIDWRQQGCCAPPADRDLRLRDAAVDERMPPQR